MDEVTTCEDYFSSIELLGFAKNCIVEAKEIESNLPDQYKRMLSKAYSLLATVQEYLYHN